MIRAAIVGFGNIGHFVLEAVLASPDIEAAGIVSRSLEQKDVGGIPVAREVSELKDVDVAILCSPSRAVPDLAAKLLAEGIRTVDSYDIHTTVFDVHERLDGIAKEHGTAAVMSAGWDPGSDSMIRALLGADFVITDRRYIGHEDDTGFHHYAIDVAKHYGMED